jgi:hypothetical protein
MWIRIIRQEHAEVFTKHLPRQDSRHVASCSRRLDAAKSARGGFDVDSLNKKLVRNKQPFRSRQLNQHGRVVAAATGFSPALGAKLCFGKSLGACLSPNVFREGEFRFFSSPERKAICAFMSITQMARRSSGSAQALSLLATSG